MFKSANKNKRVLFAVSDVSSHGGIQRFNITLSNAMLELGNDVILICLSSSKLPGDFKSINLPNEQFHFHPCRGSKLKFVFNCFIQCVLQRPDISICGHINQSIPLSIIFRLTLIKSRIMILHGIEVWGRVSSIRGILSKLFTKILSVSAYTRDSYLSQVGNKNKNKCFIFPNTVQEGSFIDTKFSNYNQNTKNLVLLSVSRLDKTERNKGIVDVINSISLIDKNKINAIKYIIVGDGDDRVNLASIAKKRGIADQVEFRGRVTENALRDAYSEADVFILPSNKEGFGIVFLEAMLFSLPVVGAAEKGALDVIVEGKNGLLVSFGNKEQICNCIEKLFDNNELRQTLGHQGYAMVTKNGKFSYRSYLERVRGIILE